MESPLSLSKKFYYFKIIILIFMSISVFQKYLCCYLFIYFWSLSVSKLKVKRFKAIVDGYSIGTVGKPSVSE